MIKVVPDSNVWISAFNFGGVPRRIVEMGSNGEIELCISDEILAEIQRVQTEKFKWSPERLQEWQNDILTFTRRVQPTQQVDVISTDPTDNRILECALAAEAANIVTGDKHLLRLLAFTKTSIIKPSDLARCLQSHGTIISLGF